MASFLRFSHILLGIPLSTSVGYNGLARSDRNDTHVSARDLASSLLGMNNRAATKLGHGAVQLPQDPERHMAHTRYA